MLSLSKENLHNSRYNDKSVENIWQAENDVRNKGGVDTQKASSNGRPVSHMSIPRIHISGHSTVERQNINPRIKTGRYQLKVPEC